MRGSVVGIAAVMAVAIAGTGVLAWNAVSSGKGKPVKVTPTREHADRPAPRANAPRTGRPPATVDEPAEAPPAPRLAGASGDGDDPSGAARQPGASGASGDARGPNRPAGVGLPGSGADPFLPSNDPARPGPAGVGTGAAVGSPLGAFPVRADGRPACPMNMVDVGSFCIDITEVTNTAYRTFLDTKPNRHLQPATCSWNDDFMPSTGAPPVDNGPVVGVDWCDAWLYCAWAGKRLCGGMGGGAVSPGAFADASRNEWFNVCTNGGATAFSYGDTFDGSRCAHATDDGSLAQVASFPTCVGNAPPYDAVFDMSGNAWEWEDSCSGAAGEKDLCRVRGGGTHASSVVVSCSMDYVAAREAKSKTVGIRCCGARRP